MSEAFSAKTKRLHPVPNISCAWQDAGLLMRIVSAYLKKTYEMVRDLVYRHLFVKKKYILRMNISSLEKDIRKIHE
jgi:hypothetical protein